MSTPATAAQNIKLLTLFQEAGATSAQMQSLLAHGSFLVQMLRTDLTQVDPEAFATVLSSIPWTPVSEYAERIAKRNKLRNWGLTDKQIAAFASSCEDKDHLDLLHPLGAELWLGELAYTWDELMLWINDGLRELDFSFRYDFDPKLLEFTDLHSHLKTKSISLAGLDLEKYRSRDLSLVCPGDILHNERSWPGLSVATTLALSPQILTKINGKFIPNIFIGGLVASRWMLPVFTEDSKVVEASVRLNDGRWYSSTVAAHRDI